MARFDGRCAVVVGAGRGIGAAIAQRLARDGAAVVAADLDLDAAAAVAGRIGGAQVAALQVDVCDDRSVAALMAQAAERFGGVDLLSNNVASAVRNDPGGDADAVSIGIDAFDAAMRVNLRGMLLGCRHAIAHMQRRGGGAIVNMSSVSSLLAEPSRVAYSLAKAGVNALTRHVAARWGSQGIRCNAVAPGVTLTEVARAVLAPAALETMLARLPSTRLAEPADIAAIVSFLLSDEAMYIQGQTIVADGGLTIAPAN
ncbi:MAG: SDR family NAD(P)-dependent oxidoreductase [Gammaproteobacteria bacterium]